MKASLPTAVTCKTRSHDSCELYTYDYVLVFVYHVVDSGLVVDRLDRYSKRLALGYERHETPGRIRNCMRDEYSLSIRNSNSQFLLVASEAHSQH